MASRVVRDALMETITIDSHFFTAECNIQRPFTNCFFMRLKSFSKGEIR